MRTRQLLVFLTCTSLACGGHHANLAPVPQTMNDALNTFLSAVKAKDLHAMATVWGNGRDLQVNIDKPDRFRERVTVLQIYLSNKGYRVVDGPVADEELPDARVFHVELQRSACNVVVP